MIYHAEITDSDLKKLLRDKDVALGGNQKLKIYGLLGCSSGRRMTRENRVFFISLTEALQNSYRPCGNCLPAAYKQWKNGLIQ
jgi:methylphosphotriester-DNA--protein-cysteine methyltransferase